MSQMKEEVDTSDPLLWVLVWSLIHRAVNTPGPFLWPPAGQPVAAPEMMVSLVFPRDRSSAPALAAWLSYDTARPSLTLI